MNYLITYINNYRINLLIFILKLVEDVLYEYPEIETYVQVNIVKCF